MDSALMLASGPLAGLAAATPREQILPVSKKVSPNDAIRVGVVGFGIMGNNDVKSALKVPGVELVAVSDLYQGTLDRAKEVDGKEVFTTRDYREITNRKDIDAVIVATSDNWHARVTTNALQNGKAVYREKPMVLRINEELPMLAAQKQTRKILQVGSQRVSSVVYEKAPELLKAGEIGKLNMIEASFERQSALGAWQYTMPTDGSWETVSLDRYIAGMPNTPYDPKKFFWWRN